jgi:hypothetical protein
MEEGGKTTQSIGLKKHEGKSLHERPKRRWENNIKIDLK